MSGPRRQLPPAVPIEEAIAGGRVDRPAEPLLPRWPDLAGALEAGRQDGPLVGEALVAVAPAALARGSKAADPRRLEPAMAR